MKSSYWRRDEPQFFNIFGIDLKQGTGPAVTHRSEAGILSRDDRTGSKTLLARAPAGWQHMERGDEATIELIVLEGDLSVNEQWVGSGGYVFVPQHSEGCELSSEAGALMLVFWNPSMPLFPPPYSHVRATKSWQQPWEETPVPQVVHGIFHKSLRQPDFSEHFQGGPAGYIRWVLTLPGYSDGRQHIHHECWEELILLRGDMLMPESGLMGLGSYVGNPQEYFHAPMLSHGGGLFIVHTDAPQGAWGFRDYPNGPEIAQHFLDTQSWAKPQEHESWDAPRYDEWRQRPEYEAWRASPESDPWSDKVGRNTASKFLSRWTMADAAEDPGGDASRARGA